MQYPIEYKTIPVQFAFLVSKDGTIEMKSIPKTHNKLKFKDEKEARKYIKNLKELLN